MKLRSYLYINKRLVDDYLSAIEGSIYEEEFVKSMKKTVEKSDIESGLPNIGTAGQLNVDEGQETNRKAQITYAAKLKKIVDYLEKNEELREMDDLDESKVQTLKRDEIIEVFVNVRSSKVQQLLEGMKKIKDMFFALKDMLELSEDNLEVFNQIQSIELMKEKSDNGTCQIILQPDGYENISLIAQIEKEFLFQPIEKINKQCYILCKVQRKLKPDERVEIDSLLEGMEGLKPFMNDKINFSNPKELVDIVNAPGLFVLPIAIYQ